MTDPTLLTGKGEFLARAASCIPGGLNTSQRRVEPALVPVRAQGAYFWDADGTKYLDYHAAFGPIVLGHCLPRVNQQVMDAVAEVDLFGLGVTPLEIDLAEKLVENLPSAERVLLCNSGSEGTYHALRLARGATGRKKILKFQGCYHGFHDSVLLNVISPPERLGMPDPLSAGSMADAIASTIVCDYNNLDHVEDAVAREGRDIAAIIVEPIPHNIGCVLPQPGFLEGLREIATHHGIVLIFDEVITGFRHSLGGYQKVCGVTPDLTVLAKAIANGYPIAALAGRADLMERFDTKAGGKVFFAGTYNGHAVGCAAALATIEILSEDGAYEHLFAMGDRLRRGLQGIMDRAGVPAVVAGFGSVLVTYFMDHEPRNYTDLLDNDAKFFVEYRRRMIAKGVYELPTNLKRSHVSLSHSEADIDCTLQAAEDTIREMK